MKMEFVYKPTTRESMIETSNQPPKSSYFEHLGNGYLLVPCTASFQFDFCGYSNRTAMRWLLNFFKATEHDQVQYYWSTRQGSFSLFFTGGNPISLLNTLSAFVTAHSKNDDEHKTIQAELLRFACSNQVEFEMTHEGLILGAGGVGLQRQALRMEKTVMEIVETTEYNDETDDEKKVKKAVFSAIERGEDGGGAVHELHSSKEIHWGERSPYGEPVKPRRVGTKPTE